MGSGQIGGGKMIFRIFPSYVFFRLHPGPSAIVLESSRSIVKGDPIAEERQVVTASWKRLGVVSGLRRTSTPPVVGTLFFRLLCVRFKMLRAQTSKDVSVSKRRDVARWTLGEYPDNR